MILGMGLWKVYFSIVSWPSARFHQQEFLQGDFSELNLVPTPQMYILKSVPSILECDVFGDRIFKEVIKLKMRPLGWTLINLVP